jgi:hypothetical protein
MDPASDRACDERSALPPLRWIAEEDLLLGTDEKQPTS